MKIIDFCNKLDISSSLAGDIKGVVENSRDIQHEFFFAALSNNDQTGKYIQEAIKNGATGILTCEETYEEWKHIIKDHPTIISSTPRLTFAKAVALFHPCQPQNVVAVTGTNGKSSTVSFFRQMGHILGLQTASIGTLGVYTQEKINFPNASLTTPTSLTTHAILEELETLKITHAAMEASSHGLDQYRIHGVNIKAAAFTNFTQDHLDYHGSMSEYFNAKMKLFTQVLKPGSIAVLNADIPEFEIISNLCIQHDLKILSYGKKGQDIKIINSIFQHGKQIATLEIQGVRHAVELSLFGEFQLYNVLTAFGLMMACGVETSKLIDCISKLEGVDGRMEFAGKTPLGCDILVDYAHTPDALENILKSVRSQVLGNIWVVFGCGGQRDPVKRPLMGAIASRLADHVIITDDNPRRENPDEIRAQIMATALNAHEIGNRFEAISYAVENMKSGDLLIVAGKGHETGQIIGDQIIPFNDIDAVQTILRKK